MAPVYPLYQDTWGYWTTGATSITASANNTVWLDWNQATGTAATTYYQSSQIWDQWNYAGVSGIRPVETPPEEVERRKRLAEENNKKQDLIKKRARKILVENLSNEQKAELKKEGHFHVETRDGQRRYRLRPGRPPIRIHGEDGRRFSYCIHPLHHFPVDDVTLALKLMIESDEDRFLSVANATPISA